MSRKIRKGAHGAGKLFAALGDGTRLAIVRKLAGGHRASIKELTGGTRLTRQAVTKHLRVLEGAGVVRAERAGRETVFELEKDALAEAREWIDEVSAQWDEALGRLKEHVEK